MQLMLEDIDEVSFLILLAAQGISNCRPWSGIERVFLIISGCIFLGVKSSSSALFSKTAPSDDSREILVPTNESRWFKLSFGGAIYTLKVGFGLSTGLKFS